MKGLQCVICCGRHSGFKRSKNMSLLPSNDEWGNQQNDDVEFTHMDSGIKTQTWLWKGQEHPFVPVEKCSGRRVGKDAMKQKLV